MDWVQVTPSVSRAGRGAATVLVALLAAVGVLLMHGVTDRWNPTSDQAGPVTIESRGATPDGGEGTLGHHSVEKCIPCVGMVAVSVGLLVTPVGTASELSRKVSGRLERITALDMSPPGPIDLCVCLR